MWDERADPNHLRTELFDEEYVFYQMIHCLPGASHHDARTRLESDSLQVVQTAEPVGERHALGMQCPVMLRIVRFVAEQVPVCSGPKKTFV